MGPQPAAMTDPSSGQHVSPQADMRRGRVCTRPGAMQRPDAQKLAPAVFERGGASPNKREFFIQLYFLTLWANPSYTYKDTLVISEI